MIYLEALLLTILLYICFFVTVTDIKKGIIENKRLVFAAIPSLIINVVYYAFYAINYLFTYVLNFAVISIITILFYFLNIWAAGDSKLLIFVLFNIPARFYNNNMYDIAPGITILVIVLSLAYIYVIIESIFLGIKRQDLFKLSKLRIDFKYFIKQYILCTIYIMALNQCLLLLFKDFYMSNINLIMIFNMLLTLILFNYEVFKSIIAGVLGSLLLISTLLLSGFSNISLPDIKIYIILMIIITLRFIAEKYNYEEIEVRHLRQGMILATSTVLRFMTSKVKGLPQNTTEDLRSRITDDEVENIKRWSMSKSGKPTVIIARKIPFAIFITSGTILFILMKVCAKYVFLY